MGFDVLAARLVEAAYVADGGDLPKMANHLALHRAKYEAMVAAVLRELDRGIDEFIPYPDAGYFSDDLTGLAYRIERRG